MIIALRTSAVMPIIALDVVAQSSLVLLRNKEHFGVYCLYLYTDLNK